MAKSSMRRTELLSEVRGKFSALLGRGEGKVSIGEAARILNVSRQTVHRYVNGEVIPRGEVLMAAFRAWGLVLEYRGIKVTRTDQSGEVAKPIAQPNQLRLFQIVEELRDRDL
jgi:transcriptional regulator with XRE-family HTH domain